MNRQIEALKLALEALEESLGYVQEEAENAQRLYGQYPTRQARIQGLKDDARKHMDAITAIREALAEQQRPQNCGTGYCSCIECPYEQPAQQQEPVGVVGTDIGGTHLMYGTQYVGKAPDKKTAIFFKDVTVGQPLYTSPQPAQQEPVGKWMGDCIEWTENPYKFRKGQPIYTSPQPSKPWVGLTDDAILDMAEGCTAQYHDLLALARTIEAKLREKNK